MPRTRFLTLAERLNADIDKDGDCWLWTGFRNKGGYGMLTYRNTNMYAHRAAYEAFVGPVPEGSYVLHKCDTPDCCNPSHLTLGTQKENGIDMARKRRAAGQYNLTDDDVRAIRASKNPAAKIAKDYGIGLSVVYKIRSGQRWTHVSP
jgi:hypothetical protein